ncbi:antitoxin VbhA family protein [Ralstonia solanacearum]|uniref:antitoxin VbhA family protein n=1 Tax=Ralstonia solanacearum TaxID=305 RepID=UPI0009C135AC|nr:antitoxin VbhA family protein [Ralstonia solanacearum]
MAQGPKSKISSEESARRKAAIDFARQSVRLEGFVLSAVIEEANRRFIAGELTGDQHIDAVKAAADGSGSAHHSEADD